MKLRPYVPVDQEVVVLQSTGVAGSTTGRMILTGGVATTLLQKAQVLTNINKRPFPSCFEPHYQSEAKCKVFVTKISFHSYANKTNFHMKCFALSLAFIVRFTATRKWPIQSSF